jgi:flagellar biosynthetic protein FliP
MNRLLPLLLRTLSLLLIVAWLMPGNAWAQDASIPGFDAGFVELAENVTGDEVSTAVRLVMLLTAMTFLPAVVLVMTPFTRFVIVFSLLRQALGLQQSPPNQILIGLSIFLTMLVMHPTLSQVQDEALTPYMAGEIQTGEALAKALDPMRDFMMSNVRKDDLAAILKIGKVKRPETVEGIPTTAIASAYLLSELKTAFIIAVKVYIPFLVIDIVVASVLLGMGMMVLPPVVISLPFKILIFVLMDGWALLVTSMVGNIR